MAAGNVSGCRVAPLLAAIAPFWLAKFKSSPETCNFFRQVPEMSHRRSTLSCDRHRDGGSMSYAEIDGNSVRSLPAPPSTTSGQTMRAGVYRGSAQVVPEDVPMPKISAGEVLIRVAACGICGTDVKKVQHGLVRPPQILGHEIAGTVASVGAGVDHWAVGDRVTSFHH